MGQMPLKYATTQLLLSIFIASVSCYITADASQATLQGGCSGYKFCSEGPQGTDEQVDEQRIPIQDHPVSKRLEISLIAFRRIEVNNPPVPLDSSQISLDGFGIVAGPSELERLVINDVTISVKVSPDSIKKWTASQQQTQPGTSTGPSNSMDTPWVFALKVTAAKEIDFVADGRGSLFSLFITSKQPQEHPERIAKPLPANNAVNGYFILFREDYPLTDEQFLISFNDESYCIHRARNTVNDAGNLSDTAAPEVCAFAGHSFNNSPIEDKSDKCSAGCHRWARNGRDGRFTENLKKLYDTFQQERTIAHEGGTQIITKRDFDEIVQLTRASSTPSKWNSREKDPVFYHLLEKHSYKRLIIRHFAIVRDMITVLLASDVVEWETIEADNRKISELKQHHPTVALQMYCSAVCQLIKYRASSFYANAAELFSITVGALGAIYNLGKEDLAAMKIPLKAGLPDDQKYLPHLMTEQLGRADEPSAPFDMDPDAENNRLIPEDEEDSPRKPKNRNAKKRGLMYRYKWHMVVFVVVITATVSLVVMAL